MLQQCLQVFPENSISMPLRERGHLRCRTWWLHWHSKLISVSPDFKKKLISFRIRHIEVATHFVPQGNTSAYQVWVVCVYNMQRKSELCSLFRAWLPSGPCISPRIWKGTVSYLNSVLLGRVLTTGRLVWQRRLLRRMLSDDSLSVPRWGS